MSGVRFSKSQKFDHTLQWWGYKELETSVAGEHTKLTPMEGSFAKPKLWMHLPSGNSTSGNLFYGDTCTCLPIHALLVIATSWKQTRGIKSGVGQLYNGTWGIIWRELSIYFKKEGTQYMFIQKDILSNRKSEEQYSVCYYTLSKKGGSHISLYDSFLYL